MSYFEGNCPRCNKELEFDFPEPEGCKYCNLEGWWEVEYSDDYDNSWEIWYWDEFKNGEVA